MSAGTRLMRAVAASARAAGCAVTVEAADERAWASATFTGARHALAIRADDSPRLAGWLAGLPDAGLVLPGHVLADLAVERCAGGARVHALTLDA